jgi:Arginase family
MSPPFAAPITFMGVPHRTEPGDAKAVILGLPFDCGTHPHRIGSRQGPSAIRKMSLLIRRYDAETGIDPLEALAVVDLGDAQVTPGDIEPSFRAIEAALDAALKNGAIPVTMGGDGAIVLPEMRALNRRYPDLAFVHLDAHTDAYPIAGYNTATAFSRAFEEGIVDAHRSFHVGVRSSLLVPGVYEYGHHHDREAARARHPRDLCRGRGRDRHCADLSVLRHGRVRPVGRARSLHAGLGRAFDPRGARRTAGKCRAQRRRDERQHHQPAARPGRYVGVPRRPRDVRVSGRDSAAAENLIAPFTQELPTYRVRRRTH